MYMSETSALNPFGANSLSSSFEEKIKYKYNIMKEYIKLSNRDSLIKEYEQSRYLGIMILGFVGGYFAALAITTYTFTELAFCRGEKIFGLTDLPPGTSCSTPLS